MSQKSCPVSFIKIDANIVRINAFYILLLVSLYLMTFNKFIILFLIADFSIRLFVSKSYSPLYFISSRTKELLHVKSKLEDNAPKTLATYFGFLFLVLILLFDLLHAETLFYITSAILLVCLFLELAFDYCMGCKIYYLYKRFVV
ncbi:DUF4395 domain-containing protein [Sulfurimonas autotrophica]|uniref:CDP-alcohol phosphatidyltransferase n=1 Tax=Sulfurimonas autotrophica (strain ATCC BAA-671 / DSM 16294 / JCM 11897 / OK10) TaxID=563040 RepID=E0UPG0_SULAO|nr:DUF4395 domain-containing protein [Sulfurimonas autotrophica]ADN09690.1 CDP-alcohol phosphatidyltransferase [Sulfurimonas autotrophica DSM 16294]